MQGPSAEDAGLREAQFLALPAPCKLQREGRPQAGAAALLRTWFPEAKTPGFLP